MALPIRQYSNGDPAATFAGRTVLSPKDEKDFFNWFLEWAIREGMNQDPDSENQFYDYRGAYKAGVTPPSEQGGHWPSIFKMEGHPNQIVNGIDTRTGRPIGYSKVPFINIPKTIEEWRK